MANAKISDLPPVTDVLSGDQYVLARAGTTKSIDADDLSAGIAALYPPTAAVDVSIADAGGYYSSTDVEGALQEIGSQLSVGGTSAGWVGAAETWTYASATTFTVTGDVTAIYSKGTRILLAQTTAKYFVVVGSAFSSGTTTVTITAGSDYSLANAAITSPYYSYQINPQGYPGFFAFTPTATGFSGTPTVDVMKFRVTADLCEFLIGSVSGTSNAATFELTLPVAAVDNQTDYNQFIMNSGATSTVNARADVIPGTNALLLNIRRDVAGNSFTASGTKGINTNAFKSWFRYRI